MSPSAVLVGSCEADSVVGEVIGEPCAPKWTLNFDLAGLGLCGGEMAVVFWSGLGAGFRNLEQERGVNQHGALFGQLGSGCSSTSTRNAVGGDPMSALCHEVAQQDETKSRVWVKVMRSSLLANER